MLPTATLAASQVKRSPTRANSLTPTDSPSATLLPSLTWSPAPTVTATPSPTPTALACWKRGGQIVVGEMRTELLRLPLGYRIYLPPCYYQQLERDYPTLYLIHGQSYNDDQWDRLGADETADALIASGEASPFIIVMPYDRYGGQPTESNFAQAIVEVLMPFVEENYRARPMREYRAVGGLSRGAGWAVHLAIWHWELFSALGAHSPAIFHTDAQRMRVMLDAIPPDSYPRIYIDIGDKDRVEIMDSAVWFETVLNDRDIPHEWHLFSGYHHEAYWHAHMEQYLRWYSSGW